MGEVLMMIVFISAIILFIRWTIKEIIKAMKPKPKAFVREKAVVNSLFNKGYAESKPLYLYLTGKVPCTVLIRNIHVENAIEYFRNTYDAEIADWYQDCNWHYEHNELRFTLTQYFMTTGIMLEFGRDYVEILHEPQHWNAVKEMATVFAGFKFIPNEEDEICWSKDELRTFVNERLN